MPSLQRSVSLEDREAKWEAVVTRIEAMASKSSAARGSLFVQNDATLRLRSDCLAAAQKVDNNGAAMAALAAAVAAMDLDDSGEGDDYPAEEDDGEEAAYDGTNEYSDAGDSSGFSGTLF